ncbi:MAG: tRNA (guanine(46)-N(7))-methyltransferase TrmB [Chlamydiales bacterium]|nr:tRNA (guanine(46)-N(7))-methyltransferase TrmB [Chlamydiales bacterium]
MKPKNLKSLFSWEERRPYLQDRILAVPRHYALHLAFPFPSFDHPDLFGRQAPTYVEYCSGNGDWIIEKALAFPHYNWFAVEKRFDRIQKIWSKLKNHNVANLIAVCGEAHPFTSYYLPSGSIAGCYVNFPDPWPKEKHAKHRLFQKEFLCELARVLSPDAQVTVATDHRDFIEEIALSFSRQKDSFFPAYPPPHYVTEWPEYGFSYFEKLFRDQGKTIHYLQFTKTPTA